MNEMLMLTKVAYKQYIQVIEQRQVYYGKMERNERTIDWMKV